MAKMVILLFAFVINSARGYSVWNSPNSLQPVQSLYVKPSIDGATGDLYVAATEDNGVKSQWVADNPINFLTAAHQALNLPFGSLPQDTVLTNQKRAVVTSSPVQYTYAYPGISKDGAAAVSYPYAIPTQSTATTTSESTKDCTEKTTPVYPQYSPFNYFYPQMSAFASAALSALKEAGVSDDKANSVLAQATPSVWPQAYSYPGYPSYPVQYVMVDPSAWPKYLSSSESTSVPTTTTSPTSIESNKSEETQ